MPDLKQMQEQAVDLNQVARDAEVQRAAREAAAQQEAEAFVAGWESRMQRAFKGIVSRPVRRAMLMRATAPEDA